MESATLLRCENEMADDDCGCYWLPIERENAALSWSSEKSMSRVYSLEHVEFVRLHSTLKRTLDYVPFPSSIVTIFHACYHTPNILSTFSLFLPLC